jgi:hypothetical protein
LETEVTEEVIVDRTTQADVIRMFERTLRLAEQLVTRLHMVKGSETYELHRSNTQAGG